MRKKMMILALLLAPVAGLSSPPADATGSYACPICTTYPNGVICCVSCWCDGSGRIMACAENYCSPDVN